jgi:hypothetical protein
VSKATDERIARNNVIFREANEKIRASAERYDPDIERIPFICECAAPECMEILQLTRDEYLAVRRHDCHFMTADGHEAAEGVRAEVVSREDGFLVVEKPLPTSVVGSSTDAS